jgi:nucleotide-binding universal stress UspA family protein
MLRTQANGNRCAVGNPCGVLKGIFSLHRVRSDLVGMFKTVLAAIDGSAATERLLMYLLHFGKTEQATLHIVHAYQLPSHYAANEGYAELAEAYRRVAMGVVQDARAFLQEANIEALGEAIEGSPAEVILGEAERIGADLILIGSRNPTQVHELLLGSVSQQVLNAARVPVLVIP